MKLVLVLHTFKSSILISESFYLSASRQNVLQIAMGKAALATKQKKDNDKSKAPLHKIKKENLKNPRPRKKSVKLADKDVRVKISTGELQQVGLMGCLDNLCCSQICYFTERATEMYTERPEKSLHQVWPRQPAQQARGG